MSGHTPRISLIFLIIASSALFLFAVVVPASATTINVPDDYATISEAYAHATDGDTLLISNGTYYDHLTISKEVTINGESMDGVVLENDTYIPIYIRTSNITLSNMTVKMTGSLAGVSVVATPTYLSNITFSHLNITGGSNGVFAQDCTLNIADSDITNTEISPFLQGAIRTVRATVYVDASTITGNPTTSRGIYSSHSSTLHINSSKVSGSVWGAYLMDSTLLASSS
ncbi:MAG: right-handed parallel beta-helix repeat-containing protein, partial [Methermicoccaceae archaeon]